MTIAELVELLSLRDCSHDVFEGRTASLTRHRVFGGQVIAQALTACARTVDDRAPHSLHMYFLIGGDPTQPITYQVQRLREGRSFATRRCDAMQNGEMIATLTASFQQAETGFEHQIPMPDVPSPQALIESQDWLAEREQITPRVKDRYFSDRRPIELRPVTLSRYFPLDQRPKLPPQQYVWFRTPSRLPDDPAIHRMVLAYLSDMTLLDTALVPHGRSVMDDEIAAASLDHALWFHRPFRCDDWLLYAQEAITTTSGRGLTRGHFFDQAGTLVASVCQEGMLRQRRRP